MSIKTNKAEQMSKINGVSQDTIVYRLEAVEIAVKEVRSDLKESHTELMTKLDIMAKNFATHKDIDMAKTQAEMEHKAIYEKIGDIEKDVNFMKKKNWIQNTLSAILGVILTLLITYVFSDIIH